jgi:hypothetical protein
MQNRCKHEAVQLQLRTLLPQGQMLRMRDIPQAEQAASRVLLPERCRAHLRQVVFPFREAGQLGESLDVKKLRDKSATEVTEEGL